MTLQNLWNACKLYHQGLRLDRFDFLSVYRDNSQRRNMKCKKSCWKNISFLSKELGICIVGLIMFFKKLSFRLTSNGVSSSWMWKTQWLGVTQLKGGMILDLCSSEGPSVRSSLRGLTEPIASDTVVTYKAGCFWILVSLFSLCGTSSSFLLFKQE